MRLFTVLLSVAACSFSASAQPAKTGPGPCALLTRADVQEAAGAPATEGAVNASNKTVCDFKVGGAGVVNVALAARGPADTAAKVVEELKKRKIAAELAPALGKDAYASSPGYGMQQVGVFKGSSQVIVTVLLFGAPEAKSRQTAEKLVAKALARVP